MEIIPLSEINFSEEENLLKWRFGAQLISTVLFSK
jgi:hypothetical protein